MKYLSTFETARKWNLSARQVARLCVEERIPDVQKVGNNWIIPEDAKKPDDNRVKSGRYMKRNGIEPNERNRCD